MKRCNGKPWILTAISLLLTAAFSVNAAAYTPPPPIVLYIYSWNPAAYTYHQLPGDRSATKELWAQLEGYKPLKDAQQEQEPVDLLAFLVTMTNNIKHYYYITETQLYTKEEGVLDATPQQCKALHELAKTSNKGSFSVNAQWLGHMSSKRLTELRFTGSSAYTSQSLNFTTSKADAMVAVALELCGLNVKPDSAVRVDGKLDPAVTDKSMVLKLTFDSGVVYDVYITGDSLSIMSSDMSFSLTYTLTSAEAGERLRSSGEYCYYNHLHRELELPPHMISDCPDTGKPVIYLYPEKQTDVNVKLDFQGDLFYTFPAYSKDAGWNVTAYPDGRLVNKPDKSEHYYLFWDGNSDTVWKQDEGFCVAGKDTEAFLKQKLPLLGLTPREYNDFITFWVPRLKENPYNLITFAGQQYEELAPLTVTPAPDSVLRVHMVYKPLQKWQDIPEQKLTGGFTRKGFTVVEWGGSVAK